MRKANPVAHALADAEAEIVQLKKREAWLEAGHRADEHTKSGYRHRIQSLEAALQEQMIEVDGEPHAYACPKAHRLERECDTRCTDAVAALTPQEPTTELTQKADKSD